MCKCAHHNHGGDGDVHDSSLDSTFQGNLCNVRAFRLLRALCDELFHDDVSYCTREFDLAVGRHSALVHDTQIHSLETEVFHEADRVAVYFAFARPVS